MLLLRAYIKRGSFLFVFCFRARYAARTSPLVRFWFKRDWLNFKEKKLQVGDGSQSLRGKTRISQGFNVNMHYVEDASGIAVEGNLAAAMRALAQSNWVKFALTNSNAEPLSWGLAHVDLRRDYFHQMSAMFVELRLCDADCVKLCFTGENLFTPR